MKHISGIKVKRFRYTMEDYEKLKADYEENYDRMIDYLEEGGTKDPNYYGTWKIYVRSGDERHQEFLRAENRMEFLCHVIQKQLGIYAQELDAPGRPYRKAESKAENHTDTQEERKAV